MMSKTSMTILANMAQLQYHPRWCHIKSTLQVGWIYCVKKDDGNRQTGGRTDRRRWQQQPFGRRGRGLTMKRLFSIMSKLQTHYYSKLGFQKVNQHKGGKWLIHGTKHDQGNQLQSPSNFGMLHNDRSSFLDLEQLRIQLASQTSNSTNLWHTLNWD